MRSLEDLEPQKQRQLYTSDGQILLNKYIAITIRRDSIGNRAGFDDKEELRKLISIIYSKGFIPVIIACTQNEINMCDKIKDAKILPAISIEDQTIFYSQHCYGMVGTNGSCCNIPSLYDIPMFILARERTFPDDFYCFGRLISPYIENHPYNGKLWKSDRVLEYTLNHNEKTSIDKYNEEFNDWLYGIGKNILQNA